MRAALTHGVDRAALMEVYRGFAQEAYLPASPEADCYDSALAASYGYDPAAFSGAIPSGQDLPYLSSVPQNKKTGLRKVLFLSLVNNCWEPVAQPSNNLRPAGQSRNPSRTSCSLILVQSATGRFTPSTNRIGQPKLLSSI